MPAGFAAEGVEDFGQLMIGGDLVCPVVEHALLLRGDIGGPGADFFAKALGGAIEDVFERGGGQGVLQPGADELGLLVFVEHGDVGG